MDQFGSSWAALIPPTVTHLADGSTGLVVALSILPILTLSVGRDYYVRARHNGVTLGAGVWSPDSHIRT